MIEKYINYAKHVNVETDVIDWLQIHLLSYLKNNQEDQQEIEHIIDYFNSDKRPKRLSRMSYEQAKNNTEKWNKSLIKKGSSIKETAEDIEIIKDFGDGFKIVKLVGENAYKREGFLMRHCVASYYGRNVEVYSLRDENNIPHCTMEKNQQIKGKGNGPIHPKYINYIIAFLEEIGMAVGDSEMKNLGYMNVSKIKGDLHKDTKYVNDVYVPEDIVLKDTQNNDYYSFDLLDIKPLIKEVNFQTKINFDLNIFIKESFKKLKNASSGNYTRNASSGDYTQNASSGNSTQNASSGNSTRNASSGNRTQNASSGDRTQNASSGDRTQNASSGDSTRNASSGNYTQNASSGDYTQNASSGDYTQNASSGNSTQNASSGNSTRNASSGDNTRNASSGYDTRNASSGNYTRNASSGDNTRNASSGYDTRNASSGNYTQNASSGNYTQTEINGKYGVTADIGMGSRIKGVSGTLFCLCEYDHNNNPLKLHTGKIGLNGIKPDTWYHIQGGKICEVGEDN